MQGIGDDAVAASLSSQMNSQVYGLVKGAQPVLGGLSYKYYILP